MDSPFPEPDLLFECRQELRSSICGTAAGVSNQLPMTADNLSFPVGTSAQEVPGTIQSP